MQFIIKINLNIRANDYKCGQEIEKKNCTKNLSPKRVLGRRFFGTYIM